MVAYFDPHPNETIYQAQNSHRLPASLEVPTPNSMAGCWLGGWWFLSSKPTEFRTKEFCIKLISVLNEAAMPNTSRPKKRPGHAVPGNRQEPIWVPNGLSTYDYSDYRLKTNDGLGGKKHEGSDFVNQGFDHLLVQWGVTPLPINQTVEKGNNYVRVSECWLQCLSPRINQLYLCLASNQWP